MFKKLFKTKNVNKKMGKYIATIINGEIMINVVFNSLLDKKQLKNKLSDMYKNAEIFISGTTAKRYPCKMAYTIKNIDTWEILEQKIF